MIGQPDRLVDSFVTDVSLRGFRTYARLELELGPGMTVLCGRNGVGKTNLAEAISIGCAGVSPRTSSEFRCIRDGETFARIALHATIGTARHERVVLIEAGSGKRLQIDQGVVRSLDEFAATLPVVAFLPERLLVVRGAPARRRALLDRCVARVLPRAAADLRHYAAAMTQRNNLLRRAKAGADVREQVEPWTLQLVEYGQLVRTHRAEVLESLNTAFCRRFADLTGFSDGELTVEPRGTDDLAAEFADSWPADVRRGTTTVGPHLDDLTYRQGERDLRAFGSTGEQRAALLAWSLAEADVIAETTGHRPVLVFDEPYAELDRDRRRLLTATLRSFPQVIVTTTEPPEHLAAVEGDGIRLLRVDSGTVSPWTEASNSTI